MAVLSATEAAEAASIRECVAEAFCVAHHPGQWEVSNIEEGHLVVADHRPEDTDRPSTTRCTIRIKPLRMRSPPAPQRPLPKAQLQLQLLPRRQLLSKQPHHHRPTIRWQQRRLVQVDPRTVTEVQPQIMRPTVRYCRAVV